MIEELKMILDAIGDLGPYAIMIVVGFFVYKLALYMASIGIMFKLVSMLMIKIHDIYSKRLDNQKIVDEAQTELAKNPPADRTALAKELIDDEAETMLGDILNRIRLHDTHWYPGKTTGNHVSDYIHTSDMRWLAKVVETKIKEDLEERKAK